MAQSRAPRNDLKPPAASRQVQFHQLLVAARKTWLIDALSEALAEIGPATLKEQIIAIVPGNAQKILAAAGIRDEHVFPTPVVLETKPTLVGYYRLLLGAPQKSFYHGRTGLGRFKSMEMGGVLREAQKADLPRLCEAMSKPLADLVVQLSPRTTVRDIAELPPITLGSFFQGQNNVAIGKEATKDVFLAIGDIVARFVVERTEQRLVIKNASGRTVRLLVRRGASTRPRGCRLG